MKDNKTQPTNLSVDDFVASVIDAKRKSDALKLVGIMHAATSAEPVMWGPSIIGFGSHHYAYESGREGDTPAVGFSPRKAALVIYGLYGHEPNRQVAEKLGAKTDGKGCVYIKDLDIIDQKVLATMITSAFKARHNA